MLDPKEISKQTWNSNERLLGRIIKTQYKASIQLCVLTASSAIKDATNPYKPS